MGYVLVRTYYDVDIEFALDFLAVFVVADVLDIFGWCEKATDAFFDSVSAHLASAFLIYSLWFLIFILFLHERLLFQDLH